MPLLSQLFSESLLVEVDCMSEAWLHLWYLVTDDLHQHFGELHLQGLGLTKSVETEVQQVSHQLENTDTKFNEKHVDCCLFQKSLCFYFVRIMIVTFKHFRTVLYNHVCVYTLLENWPLLSSYQLTTWGHHSFFFFWANKGRLLSTDLILSVIRVIKFRSFISVTSLLLTLTSWGFAYTVITPYTGWPVHKKRTVI